MRKIELFEIWTEVNQRSIKIDNSLQNCEMSSIWLPTEKDRWIIQDTRRYVHFVCVLIKEFNNNKMKIDCTFQRPEIQKVRK